jgi:hypothetical protein
VAIMVPDWAAKLFLVLTGSQFPDVNEDVLRELGGGWRKTGGALGVMEGDLVGVVERFEGAFSGKAASRFRASLEPYLSGKYSMGDMGESFGLMAEVLDQIALQVEHAKIVTLGELATLWAQFAWAAGWFPVLGGVVAAWLSAQIAVVRALLSQLWNRVLTVVLMLLRAVSGQMVFQVGLNAGGQLVQNLMGTRGWDEWDEASLGESAKMALMATAVGLGLGPLGQLLGQKLGSVLSRRFGDDLDPKIANGIDDAIDEQLGKVTGSTTISQFAQALAAGIDKHSGLPVKAQLAAKTGEELSEVITEGLVELFAEAAYNAASGADQIWNLFAFTAGLAEGLATLTGKLTRALQRAIGTILGIPVPDSEPSRGLVGARPSDVTTSPLHGADIEPSSDATGVQSAGNRSATIVVSAEREGVDENSRPPSYDEATAQANAGQVTGDRTAPSTQSGAGQRGTGQSTVERPGDGVTARPRPDTTVPPGGARPGASAGGSRSDGNSGSSDLPPSYEDATSTLLPPPGHQETADGQPPLGDTHVDKGVVPASPTSPTLPPSTPSAAPRSAGGAESMAQSPNEAAPREATPRAADGSLRTTPTESTTATPAAGAKPAVSVAETQLTSPSDSSTMVPLSQSEKTGIVTSQSIVDVPARTPAPVSVGTYLMNDNEGLDAAIELLPKENGVHGVVTRTPGAGEAPVTVAEVVAALRAGDWNGVDPIRLYMCDIGDLATFAQELSDALGVDVLFPDGWVWLGPVTGDQVIKVLKWVDGRPVLAPGGWLRQSPGVEKPVPAGYDVVLPADTPRGLGLDRDEHLAPRVTVVGEPDWTPVRDEVTRQLVDSPTVRQWVANTITHAFLKKVTESGGARTVQFGDIEVEVRVSRYGTVFNALTTMADQVIGHEARPTTATSTDEQDRNPINLSTVAGGVASAAMGAAGVPVTATLGVPQTGVHTTATQGSAEGYRHSTELTERKVVTETNQTVRLQVTTRSAPGQPAAPRKPPKIVSIPMTLDWPGPRMIGGRTIQRGYYPDPNEPTPAETQKSIKHVEFTEGLVGEGSVFDQIVAHYGLGPKQANVQKNIKGWLLDLATNHGTELIMGGFVRNSFTIRKEPVEIIIALGGDETAYQVGDGDTTVVDRQWRGEERSTSQSRKQEKGLAAGVATTGIPGMTSAGIRYEFAAETEDTESVDYRHDRETVERITGRLEKFEADFDFMVGLGAGTVLESGERLAPTLEVPGSATFRAARPGEMRSTPSPHSSTRSVDSVGRGRSGMPLRDVPEQVHSHWELTPETVAAITGMVLSKLARDGVIRDQDVSTVKQDLRGFLNPKAEAILKRGDYVPFPLPGGGNLYLGGDLDDGQGRYSKEASWLTLADTSTATAKTQFKASRSFTKAFYVIVETTPGAVTIGGQAGLAAATKRAVGISQTFGDVRRFAGTGPVHLYRFPVRITPRLGEDEPMTWSDEQGTANKLDHVPGTVEIAVPERPGEAVPADPNPEPDHPGTGWVDENDPSLPAPSRPATLPVDQDLDSLATIPERGPTVRKMLALLPAASGKLKETVKSVVAGKRPIDPGAHHEADSKKDASYRQLLGWVSPSATVDNLELAVRTSDHLALETYEASPLWTGSRDLVGVVNRKMELSKAEIVGYHDKHVFTRTQHTETMLPDEESESWGPEMSASVSGAPAEAVKLAGEVSVSHKRGSAKATSDTVAATAIQSWTEPGYLVQYNATHKLHSSVHERRTGFQGARHSGPLTTDAKAMHVPKAVKVWVPASQIATIGELTDFTVHNILKPADRDAYLARHAPAGAPSPAAGTPSAAPRASASPLPSEVPPSVGDLSAARPETVPEFLSGVRRMLENAVAKVTDPEQNKAYRELVETMVGALDERLVVGGFETFAAELATTHGVPLFGQQIVSNRKLELSMTLTADMLPTGQSRTVDEYRHGSEVATTSVSSEGRTATTNVGAAVSGGPPSTGQSVVDTAASDALAPTVEAGYERTGKPEEALRDKHVNAFSWNGKAGTHEYGLKVDAVIDLWARESDIATRLPGARKPVKIEHKDGFTVDNAVRSKVGWFFTDLTTPLDTAVDPLPAGFPDTAIVQAWRFSAPELGRYLRELGGGLNPYRKIQLLVGTGTGHLAHHVRDGLSADGYHSSVGSKTISGVTVKLGLGKRELMGEIVDSEMSDTRTKGTQTARKVASIFSTAAAIIGGVLSNVVNPKFERESGEPETVTAGPAPEPVTSVANKVYLVRAELLTTAAATYKNGVPPKRGAVAPKVFQKDGVIWLRVDGAGLAALGLTMPAANVASIPTIVTSSPATTATAAQPGPAAPATVPGPPATTGSRPVPPGTRTGRPGQRRQLPGNLKGGASALVVSPVSSGSLGAREALELPAGSVVARESFRTPADEEEYFRTRYGNLLDVDQGVSTDNCFEVTVQGSYSIARGGTFVAGPGEATTVAAANRRLGATFVEATLSEIADHMRAQPVRAQGMVFLGGDDAEGHYILVHKDERGVVNFVDVKNQGMAALQTTPPVIGFVPLTWTGATEMAPPALPAVPRVADTFVRELFDAIDARVPPVAPPPMVRKGSWASVSSDGAAAVTADQLEAEYGISHEDQRRFQNIVDRFAVVLDVRPVNPAAVAWRKRGAVAKPEWIKAKTINELDTYLGASTDSVGLVGYFDPVPPDLTTVPAGTRDQVSARYDFRAQEFTELAPRLRELQDAGQARLTGGLVEVRTPDGFRLVTADNDLFDIRLPADGSPLSGVDFENLVWLLEQRDMGVQHGPHLYWQPKDETEQRVYDAIVDRHLAGEPIIRFHPFGRPALIQVGDDLTDQHRPFAWSPVQEMRRRGTLPAIQDVTVETERSPLNSDLTGGAGPVRAEARPPSADASVSDRTAALRRLLPLGLVRAEQVDGAGFRARVEQELDQARTPQGVRDQILAGISDAELASGIGPASGVERLTVTAGRGANAVELTVDIRIHDDSTGLSTVDDEGGGKIESSSGTHGKVKDELPGSKRKDGGVGGRVPIRPGMGVSAYARVNLKGWKPTSTWKSVSSVETRTAASIEPEGDRTSSRHDLVLTATLSRNDAAAPVPVSYHEPGGATLSTADVLEGLYVAPETTPASDGTSPPIVRMTAGEGLFDTGRNLVHRHPAWAGTADEIGSPVRGVLRTMASGAYLSQRGPELLGGHTVREMLEIHDEWGNQRTATIELRVSKGDSHALRTPDGDETVTGKLTSKSGLATGRSLHLSDAEPVDLTVRLKSGVTVAHDEGGGAGLSLVGVVQGKRTNHEKRVTKRTSEVHHELTWVATDGLVGNVTDLTYHLTVRFDDQRQETTTHQQPGGAVSWRAADGDTESVAGADDDTTSFPPQKILTGETRYPNLAAVEAELRAALPPGVLHTDGRNSEAHVARNEAAISRVFSERGAADRSADLGGDGMSLLLVSATHAATDAPDEYVQVVVEAVRPPRAEPPRGYGTFDQPGPGDRPVSRTVPGTSMKGKLGAKHTTERGDAVKTGYTAAGGVGVRGGLPGATGELRGGHSGEVGAAESTVDSSSGVGHEQAWKSDEVAAHDGRIDHYTITVFGDDGVIATRRVAGGAATTVTGGRFSPGPEKAHSAFRPVQHSTPRRPDGWRAGRLPDHFVVQGVDLPGGLGDVLRAGLGETGPFARHQTHEFASGKQIAASLDDAGSGVYQMPVHRRAGGLPGAADRVGDVKAHTVLSNPRISGEPEKMKLTFVAKVSGATGHGNRSDTGGSTTGRIRGSASDVPVRETIGYTEGHYSSEKHATADEFEHTTKITYKGPVYPVTYDITVLGGSRDAGADSTVTNGDDVGSWRHQEADRENAVRIWVPAPELDQIGLDVVPPVDLAAAEHADDLPPDHDIHGHTPASIRPEVVARLLDAARDLLGLVPHDAVPRSVLSQFADHVTSLALLEWVNGPVEQRAAESLYRRIVTELGRRGLVSRYQDLLGGPGIRWSQTVAGPLGTYTVSLVLRGNQSLGEYDGTMTGWTSKHKTKTTSTTTNGVNESRSRQLAARTMLGSTVDIPEPRPVRAVGRVRGALRSSLDRSESVAVGATRAHASSGEDQVAYRHGLDLELTVTKTAYASRAPQVLSGGLLGGLTPKPTSRTHYLENIPAAVRTMVPVSELAVGTLQPKRIDTLPDRRIVLANSMNLHSIVEDIVNGVRPGESTGPAPTPVPAPASSALDAINTDTRPSAVSAHLPKAMSQGGYRLGGLDHDGYYSAGAGVPNPLSALTFHAYLDGAHVTPLDGPAEFTIKDATTTSVKEKHEEGPGVQTGGRLQIESLVDSSRPVVDGNAFDYRGSARIGVPGPGYSWKRASGSDFKARSDVRKTKTVALSFLVTAWANWTVTPEYQGTTPDEWRVPRSARDWVYLYTDEAGLRAMGLEPPGW